jgi:flavorubredoxin
VDGDEAVVIDSGSRPDFPVVMMKILQTGIMPSAINALIYQHYDPDLCGNISNFENIIDRKDLILISDSRNNMFIRHYSVSSKLVSLDAINHRFTFSSGRELKFFNTPYSHSAGSFVSFDAKTGVLFTSDLFGSFGAKWDLFQKLGSECRKCVTYTKCQEGRDYCPLPDILRFHKEIMTSGRALQYAIEQIEKIPATMLTPQHGSIISNQDDIAYLCSVLKSLKNVGIDGVIGPYSDC